MNIYLAGRYSRRVEFCVYRGQQLRAMGHSVVVSPHRRVRRVPRLIQACDLLIAFTEPPRSGGGNRGGRHVELGIALGQGKKIMIVGPRENLFCWLPECRQFDAWEQCLAYLQAGVR